LKNEIEEMKFAVEDDKNNLLTYTEGKGGESGKVIYWLNNE